MSDKNVSSQLISGARFKKFLMDKVYWFNKTCSEAIEVTVSGQTITLDNIAAVVNIENDAEVEIISGTVFINDDLFSNVTTGGASVKEVFNDWASVISAECDKTNPIGKYESTVWFDVKDADALYKAASESSEIIPESLLNQDGTVNVIVCLRHFIDAMSIPGVDIDFVSTNHQASGELFPILNAS